MTEGLDAAQRALGIAEGQRELGEHAAIGLRQRHLGDPTVVGPAQLELHLLLGMQADVEHARGEEAGIIDAHGVHPALTQLGVAQTGRIGLLGGAQGIARHAPAHVLEAGGRGQHAATTGLGAGGEHELLEHLVLHEGENFAEVFVLVMMGVHVDDKDFVELVVARLLGGVGEKLRRIQLFNLNAAATI